MFKKTAATALFCVLLSSSAVMAAGTAAPTAADEPYAGNIVRLSKITVDPAQVEAYKVFAAEVGRESMKNEPGVRVLYSVQEKKDPTKFTILEIYESDAAYKHHIGTAHFKKYKEGTIKMVTDLQLIDCNPLVPEALIKPAK